MADTGKKVEVRFGTFSCSIEGYDDPVERMREILMLMQQMIRETPALTDQGADFGEDEVARIESALERRDGGREHEGPGVVVIRAGANNTQIGTVTYPALGCSGTWTLRRSERIRVEVVEHITVNGQCLADVVLEVRPTADGKLYVASAGETAPTVWATLTKTG